MKTHETTLIKGTFNKEQARSLLLELLNRKINFHHVQELSSEERNEQQARHHRARIQELERERMALAGFLHELDGKHDIRIDCTIAISSPAG